ncbi:MAG: hypothetical protein FJX72_16135, partial [Armatimonadetes bacterium]|nr:hypothetical protein [Armatimonadota bacterium]
GLAWFLIHVMHDLAEMLELSGESEEARGKRQEAIALRARAARLAAAVEEHCWDGAWYLRATFDDGTPIGSARNSEARIDTIAQSWAVICGRADPARSAMAMGAVQEHLVRADEGMVLLFDPPFEHTTPNPGYIMSYPPGVRENGGQYTHGSLWAPLALARLGDGDGAASLLRMMNPLSHSAAPDDVGRYMVEPYVAAADVYNLPGRVGRGGWTWYTGSASLMYRVWIEEIPGFRRSGGDLTIEPTIPESWGGFAIRYRHGRTMCRMQVENPDHVGHGVSAITLDGEPVIGPTVRMRDDGGVHVVVVTLGSVRPLPAAARP